MYIQEKIFISTKGIIRKPNKKNDKYIMLTLQKNKFKKR